VPNKEPPASRQRLFVVAALIERRGRVLLAQRRADQSFALSWEFPGGKVELGEDPRDALVREIREELDCAARVHEVVDVIFYPYPTFDLVMPVYRATRLPGRPRAAEVAAIQWVPRAELPTMTMPPADVPLAKRLASTIRTRGRRKAPDRAARYATRSAGRTPTS
jgi:8-oxo-dGTP diphosphatase